jgi:hypothetical protein
MQIPSHFLSPVQSPPTPLGRAKTSLWNMAEIIACGPYPNLAAVFNVTAYGKRQQAVGQGSSPNSSAPGKSARSRTARTSCGISAGCRATRCTPSGTSSGTACCSACCTPCGVLGCRFRGNRARWVLDKGCVRRPSMRLTWRPRITKSQQICQCLQKSHFTFLYRPRSLTLMLSLCFVVRLNLWLRWTRPHTFLCLTLLRSPK